MSTDFGKRLLPHILDGVAATDPDRILYSILDISSDCYHIRKLSARTIARAVDKTAWWIRSKIGTSMRVRPVGYIGPHDLRHILLTYACAKAGCTALFLSPKNNVEGALAVLAAANCNIWVSPSERKQVPLVQELVQRREMIILSLPTIEELLEADSMEPFPFTKSFEDAALDPFCMLHTSGTTGSPKPISWTNALIGTMDAVRLLPRLESNEGLAPWTSLWNQGDKIYSSFPMSHGAGIIMNILMPGLFDLHCILGPIDVLPNINLVGILADQVDIDIWSMVPSLVDELGQTPDILEKLKSSKFICASGGPVSPSIAANVNDKIRVLNLTGTTEGLFIGNLVVEREDWLWFAFHPYSGFEFKEIEPGVYEHWIHRNEHWYLFQGIFHTYKETNSINLKDLYIRHPSKPNLWAFKGRSDDVVVLSNGYKIQPLSVEAFVSTHPAVNGCLMIGTGKPQAGLLVELKDSIQRTHELFDSIWSHIERSSALSLHKNQLQRNFVAFTEPDKPLIRTDKDTVKRSASLALYAAFIDRFYNSRDEKTEEVVIDTTSCASIEDSVRKILVFSIPEIQQASTDADFFHLGLDSLLVHRVINTVRNAMNLGEKLAPRHLYANPTLAKFSQFLANASAETKTASRLNDVSSTEREKALMMKEAIEQHKARLSFKMNPLDYVNPNHYMGLNLYFPLRDGISFEEVYGKLQGGLCRAFHLIPALEGKILPASEQEFGYKKGELRISIPPISSRTNTTGASKEPRQLSFQDLSKILPSFDQLREDGFLPSAIKDDLVLPCDPFPLYPADVVSARANFVDGGCILAANFHHSCLDAVGVMVALRVWAESCRFLDGDPQATCSWLDAESFNHSLPEILHDLGDHKRTAEQIDPSTWAFLPFLRPEHAHTERRSEKGFLDMQTLKTTSGTLPSPPTWDYKLVWPPVPDPQGRSLKTTMFVIPYEKIEEIKRQVITDPESKGVISSLSDIVQAFFWRAAVRARYLVATRINGKTFETKDTAILELPIDGRPYFSPLLPSTYMGSMLIVNRISLPVEELCSSATSLGRVAHVLREAAARITPQILNDAFALLQSLPYFDPQGQFSYADMGLDHMHAMISNMMLFDNNEISFGDAFFANNGSPESLRPQIERGSSRFRFLVILPLRKDGGVEIALGTLPEELEYLKADKELMHYAVLRDV